MAMRTILIPIPDTAVDTAAIETALMVAKAGGGGTRACDPAGPGRVPAPLRRARRAGLRAGRFWSRAVGLLAPGRRLVCERGDDARTGLRCDGGAEPEHNDAGARDRRAHAARERPPGTAVASSAGAGSEQLGDDRLVSEPAGLTRGRGRRAAPGRDRERRRG